MFELRLHTAARYFIYIFLFYMLWYKYVFGERRIILYGSAFAAAVLAVLDIFITGTDVLEIIPKGVILNLVMCVYSVGTGFFVARNQSALMSAVKTYAAFSLVCFAICYITEMEKDIAWLANAIILISILCSVYVITNGTYRVGYGYVLSRSQNPNSLGVAMDIGFFCVLYKMMKEKKHLLVYTGLMILFMYIIVGCGSRKCLIGAVILCVFWLIPLFWQMWKQGDWLNRTVLVILGAVLIFGVWIFYKEIYVNTLSYDRMETLGSNVEGSSSQLRKEYYELAFDYYTEEPVFGIGLDQFKIWSPYHGYAHSTYAEALADWGTVGCLMYFLPVLWVGIRLLKLSFYGSDQGIARVFFSLWSMEMFLGVGQIWFYSVDHLIAWAMIFYYVEMAARNRAAAGRRYKYVKI